MAKASLLILAHAFPPENTSGAARPYRFYKYLPDYGYECRVVAGGSERLEEPDTICRVPACTRQLHAVSAAGKACQIIQRYLLPYNEQLGFVPHAIAAGGRMLTGGDVVLSTSPPLATHMAALQLKKRHRLVWVADFRDPLFGNPFRNRKGARLYDASLERWLFGNADALLANTDVAARLWRERYPQWAEKIHVVWNGFDPAESFEPAPIPTRPYKVLAHVGALYGGRHPTLLVDCVERLIRAGRLAPACLKLDFVGPMEPGAADSLRRLEKLGCVDFTPHRVSRSQALHKIATSDFLLLLDVNASNAGYQVPAKIFDYLRTGRPVLALTARNSPVDRILADSGIRHVSIDPQDNIETIDEKMLSFLNLDATPVRTSDWFATNFDGRRQAGTVAAILDGLRSRSGPLLRTKCPER